MYYAFVRLQEQTFCVNPIITIEYSVSLPTQSINSANGYTYSLVWTVRSSLRSAVTVIKGSATTMDILTEFQPSQSCG